jgi:hypothetical protein
VTVLGALLKVELFDEVLCCAGIDLRFKAVAVGLLESKLRGLAAILKEYGLWNTMGGDSRWTLLVERAQLNQQRVLKDDAAPHATQVFVQEPGFPDKLQVVCIDTLLGGFAVCYKGYLPSTGAARRWCFKALPVVDFRACALTEASLHHPDRLWCRDGDVPADCNVVLLEGRTGDLAKARFESFEARAVHVTASKALIVGKLQGLIEVRDSRVASGEAVVVTGQASVGERC